MATREERIKNCLELKNVRIKETSANSWCFSFAEKGLSKETICEKLKGLFQISDPMFDEKFMQAVSGDGQEYEKIMNTRSSSLCALLFFFSVSEKNPIFIDDIKFTESYFEVKNRVFNNPSNMDVVLIGEKDKKRHILFIECKFSEYLYPGVVEISNAYRENEISAKIYDKAIEKGIFHKEDKKDGKPGYGYYRATQYMGGLKQIISYMINEDSVYRDNIYTRDFDCVSFVEVLFDFGSEFEKEFEAYKEESEQLIEIIKPFEKRINFLGTMSYQSIINSDSNKNFKNRLNESIKEYYQYNK